MFVKEGLNKRQDQAAGKTGGYQLAGIFNLGAVLLVLCAGIAVILLVKAHMKEQALESARTEARLLLDRNLAIHRYYSKHLKPEIFAEFAEHDVEPCFTPSWMSSTYAIRSIEDEFHNLNDSPYYYKECAINARSPENEADEFEAAFLRKLNSGSDISEMDQVRQLDGGTFFTFLQKGEVMDAGCLGCHSKPENAPAGMVETYGPERSFGRYEGEVVSAVSIRVPLDAALSRVDKVSLNLSFLLLVLLLVVVGVQLVFGRRLILEPLASIRDKATQIAEDEESLGETIPVPGGRELGETAEAFNRMSLRLRQERDSLEEKVHQRTEELSRQNSEKEKLIQELQSAASQIKTLHGLLPICSYCKKIRDYDGYWSQLETYISNHSDAELSHGICPDCIEKHFPDFADEIIDNGDNGKREN